MACASCALLAAGCGAPQPAAASEDETAATTDAWRVRCQTEKIDFTRETGCRNDGFVEFCVPKGDLALQARIARLDPEVSFVGSAGRARCDTTTELLGMYPTRKGPDGDCSDAGVLSKCAWRDVCAIAAEPSVRRIVPTFYE